jgi:AcrB/AcrD/AcrF family
MWLLWWLGSNLSVAVAVAFIALAGVAAETGVVMLIYLDHAAEEVRTRCLAQGRPYTRADLYEAIMIGAVERVRPKMMTVVAIMAGLLPIMWSTGTAHRRPDDRRDGLLDNTHADRDSRHVRRRKERRAPVSACGTLAATKLSKEVIPMMDGMMNMMGGMGWAMMLVWRLVIILLILGIAALAKYVFFK